MNEVYRTDKLSKKELGELLERIGKALREESDVSILEIESFLETSKVKRGYTSFRYRGRTSDALDDAISFLNSFRTSGELRVFLEALYKIAIPYRLSRQALVKLGVGAILTSKIDLNEAKLRWKEREEKINSLNIYQMPEEKLKKTLRDDKLFPNGYSIVSFARKFRIKLPLIKKKEPLIDILVKQVYERPLDTKKIGRWGLDEKGMG